ncbi:uncharacterized protein DS421_17g593130 [Arachis hypogaea]|nr:uncharacterized protein DS421_17g593130 [Arachis hypogaea]
MVQEEDEAQHIAPSEKTYTQHNQQHSIHSPPRDHQTNIQEKVSLTRTRTRASARTNTQWITSSGTGAGKRQGSSDQRLQQPPLASFVPFSIAVLYRSEPLVAEASIGTSGEFQQSFAGGECGGLEEYGGIGGSEEGRTVTAIMAPVKVTASSTPHRGPWLASPSSPSGASLSDAELTAAQTAAVTLKHDGDEALAAGQLHRSLCLPLTHVVLFLTSDSLSVTPLPSPDDDNDDRRTLPGAIPSLASPSSSSSPFSPRAPLFLVSSLFFPSVCARCV